MELRETLERRDYDPAYELSDREAVLQALRQAGRRGCHSLALRRGGFTANVSQRVAELREQGHVIEATLERWGRRNGCRYTLISDAGVGSVAPPAGDVSFAEK